MTTPKFMEFDEVEISAFTFKVWAEQSGYDSDMANAFIKGARYQHQRDMVVMLKLWEILEFQRKVLKFYADEKQMNHGFSGDAFDQSTCFVNEDDFQGITEVYPNDFFEHEYLIYGKQARKTLAQVETMLKELGK